MPSIRVERITRQRDSAKVYSLFRNIEELPYIIKGIKHLRVLEPLRANERLTEWVADIGGVVIGWEQKDVLDEKRMAMSFRQTKGDFKQFEGRWELHSLKEGTLLRIEATLDWGVPRWTQTTGNIFTRKATLNLRLLLKGICKAMECSSG